MHAIIEKEFVMETILMKLAMILMVAVIVFCYYFLVTFIVNQFFKNITDIKKNIEIRKK